MKKITIEIGGKDYTFEMNRSIYKRLLADEEYAKMQNELTKKLGNKNVKNGKDKDKLQKQIQEQMIDEDISKVILQNLIMEEKIFYFSLLTNHSDMTMESSSVLMDKAIEEYGSNEVSNLCNTIMENFTQREEKPKKKMVMRIV